LVVVANKVIVRREYGVRLHATSVAAGYRMASSSGEKKVFNYIDKVLLNRSIIKNDYENIKSQQKDDFSDFYYSGNMSDALNDCMLPPTPGAGANGGHHHNMTECWNRSIDDDLPREMTFNDDNLLTVIAYAILFTVATFGNLTVFITLFRNRHRRSRVNMFIMHLCIADMIVTFIMMPLEIGWNLTVSWMAGDPACRILMFFRALGFYLSSFILVSISLDRYFTILHPLSLTDADRRGRIMLYFAWLLSIIASLPQVNDKILIYYILHVYTVKLLIGAGAFINFRSGLYPVVIRSRGLLGYISFTVKLLIGAGSRPHLK
jgi:hypothetical protein